MPTTHTAVTAMISRFCLGIRAPKISTTSKPSGPFSRAGEVPHHRTMAARMTSAAPNVEITTTWIDRLRIGA